jgi:hypothetical protein
VLHDLVHDRQIVVDFTGALRLALFVEEFRFPGKIRTDLTGASFFSGGGRKIRQQKSRKGQTETRNDKRKR